MLVLDVRDRDVCQVVQLLVLVLTGRFVVVPHLQPTVGTEDGLLAGGEGAGRVVRQGDGRVLVTLVRPSLPLTLLLL